MDLVNEHLRSLERADVVSFDIFDTAVLRACFEPTDLFDVVQARILKERIGLASFKSLRLTAQELAEERFSEPGFSEIYECFAQLAALPQELVDRIQEIEFDVELALVRPHPYIRKAFAYARSLGKRIIFVSDMYYSQAALLRLLEKCEYAVETEIFVSCEYRASKSSGKLWQHVRARFEDARILHFGDNYRSDIACARKWGIQVVYIERNAARARRQVWKKALFPKHQRFQQSLALGLCAAHFAEARISDRSKSVFGGRPYTMGFAALGPLVHSFLRHLKKYCQDQSIEAIYFLARDARLFFEAAQGTAGLPPVHYLRVSRSSLKSVPLAEIDHDLHQLDMLLQPDFAPCRLEEFLQFRFGCESDDLKAFNYLHFEPSTVVTHRDLGRLRSLIVANRPLIASRNRLKRAMVERYLITQGFDSGKKAVLVDLGYNGSLQAWIRLMGFNSIHGYYLAVFPQIVEHIEDRYFQSFLGPPQDKSYSPFRFLKSLPQLEVLLAEATCSVESYDECFKTGVKPVHRQHLISEDEQALKQELYAGALDYVSILSDLERQLDLDLSLDPVSAVNGLHYIGEDMGDEDRKLLASLIFDNSFAGLEGTALGRLEGWSRVQRGMQQLTQVLPRKTQDRWIRKLKKLQKSPYLFFHDSDWSMLRWVARYL